MEKIINQKRCPKCGEIKNINEFENKKGYSCNECKLKLEEKRKEKNRQSSREYYEKNREKILEKEKEIRAIKIAKRKEERRPEIEAAEKIKNELLLSGKWKCKKCNKIKTLDNFRVDARSKSGYRNICIECDREREKKYNEENREKRRISNKQTRDKYKDKYNNQRKQKRDSDPEYRKILSQRKKEWALKNPEYPKKRYEKERDKMLDRNKRWREKNIDKYRRRMSENKKEKSQNFKNQFYDILQFKEAMRDLNKYLKNIEINEKTKQKRINNIQYKLSDNMRARIRKALKNQSAKKTKSTMDLVGCTGLELSYYLNNLGYDKDTDHIDHIIPISRFNLIDPEHQLIACHYLNLQPLEASANIRKKDSLPDNWQDVIIRICEVRNINPQSIIKHIGKTVLC